VSEVGNVKLYTSEYKNYTDTEIYLNSLNGIDSFRRFIETEFLDWAKTEYPNNIFI
jgi:hypothetical protein